MNNQHVCKVCSQQYNTLSITSSLQEHYKSHCSSCMHHKKIHIKRQSQATNNGDLQSKQRINYNNKQISQNIVLAQLISRRSSQKKQLLNSSFQQIETIKESYADLDGIQHRSMDQNRQQKQKESKIIKDPSKQSLKSNNKIEQLCQLHQKPLQIVCIKDLVQICSSCALFGQHKGHQFKSVVEVRSDKQNYYQEIISLMDKKQQIFSQIKDEKTKTQIFGILSIRKQNLIKQINSRFDNLYQQIKKTQDHAIKKCEEIIQSTKQQLNNIMSIDKDLQKQAQIWDITALQAIKVLQGKNYSQMLELLYYGGNIIQINGEKVNEKLKKQQKELLSNVEQAIDVITIDKNDKIFQTLSTFTTVSQKKLYQNQFIFAKEQFSSKNISFDFENQCQDSLLDFDFNQLNKTEEIIQKSTNILSQSRVSQVSTLKKSQASANTAITTKFKKNTNEEKTQICQSHQSSISVHEKSQKVKSKISKLKLPQKYQKVLNGIKSDSLDLVDLTNAELGDKTILEISKLIAGLTKTKTIKFIRNKLSDECIKQLLPYMSNIISLNLSQNYLTQQTLDYFAENLDKLPNLKSLILSQNKIIERKHKAKIQKLRKLGLIVSV